MTRTRRVELKRPAPIARSAPCAFAFFRDIVSALFAHGIHEVLAIARVVNRMTIVSLVGCAL
jgi:hypothetical protein